MNFNVIFKVGESVMWRCMIHPDQMGDDTNITSIKWYDATVHQTFGSAMTLFIVDDTGEPKPVPHYTSGEWALASQIGILDPELATERLRTHIQKKINNQKAQHQTAMNKLRHEMRSIDIKGFVDESAVLVEANA